MLTRRIPAISCGHCARAIDATTAVIDTRAENAVVRERLAARGGPPQP